MGNKGYAEFWRANKVYYGGCGIDKFFNVHTQEKMHFIWQGSLEVNQNISTGSILVQILPY